MYLYYALEAPPAQQRNEQEQRTTNTALFVHTHFLFYFSNLYKCKFDLQHLLNHVEFLVRVRRVSNIYIKPGSLVENGSEIKRE